jgi:integrase/recombinase XerC
MGFGPSSWKLSSEKLLTREEVKRVLRCAECNDDSDYHFFALKANTGLRVGELVALRWRDFHPNSYELIVTRLKKRKPSPEPMAISIAVTKLLTERSRSYDWRPTQKSSFIFPGLDHGHISIREMQRHWKDYLVSLKLYRPGRGIHILRHYAGTEFYSKTRDLRATQLFLGHSSSAITETYAHVVDMRERIEKVEPTL